VIAFRCGSVPEIIEPGVTGFVVDSIGEAVHAVEQVTRMDRSQCRRVACQRFRASRMAEEYVREYQRLIEPQGSNPDLYLSSVA
jgi:glycosyltransferase involved in cell wall biosynthesis